MPALYTHTTRATGSILTATIYNGDHQKHIDNGIPTMLDDYSSNATEMRTQTDPGESGSESLATNLAGELARLRFIIAEMKGTTYWYQTAIPLAKIAQVVNTQTGVVSTGTTTIPVDDTIPQNTEGNEFMTLAITPKAANSTLIIEVELYGSHSATGTNTIALFQDSIANALAAGGQYQDSIAALRLLSLRHKMIPGTTSPITFKVRVGNNNAGTFTFNGASGARLYGGVIASSITITEILA